MQGSRLALVLALPIIVCALLGNQLVTAPVSPRAFVQGVTLNLPVVALVNRMRRGTSDGSSLSQAAGLSTSTLSISPATSSSSSSSTISTTSTTSTTPTKYPTRSAVDLIPSTSSALPNSEPTSTPMSSGMTIQHRNLIIILSSVLGVIGIVLIFFAICLTCRYRRGKAPFRERGGTPINDDEIESWRNTLEQKRPIMGAVSSPHTPRGASIDSIALKHSPNWTWTPPSHGRHPSLQYAGSIPQAPDFVARAPNSRAGLTDETVPGADPFIGTVKRQSSRLSKPPPGHARTKSRRSSISAKSMWSYNGPISELKSIEAMPTWFDPEDDSVAKGLRGDSNSSPGTSIFDDLNAVAGGLSPRPKSKSISKPWNQEQAAWNKETETDIGRAIA